MPVAVDEGKVPRDWVLVVVQSSIAGERLGEAKRLKVLAFNVARRVALARRVARKLDVLVRGVGARVDGCDPEVECVEAPECRVASQRILSAFGMLVGRVAAAGELVPLDVKSEGFVANVSHSLRSQFSFFSK